VRSILGGGGYSRQRNGVTSPGGKKEMEGGWGVNAKGGRGGGGRFWFSGEVRLGVFLMRGGGMQEAGGNKSCHTRKVGARESLFGHYHTRFDKNMNPQGKKAAVGGEELSIMMEKGKFARQ